MADKSISELTAASQVGATDLFVLEQGNVAKKLTGQILENWLLAMAQGHGGIQNISKTGTSTLVDTYTIEFSDDTETTFTVTNGKGISNVTKTDAVAPSLTDTYTITYNDGTSYSFEVDNGKGISSIEKTSTSGLNDTYTITYTNGTTGSFTVTNGKGITGIADKWAVSSSNTATPTTWYNAVQTMTATNRYLWHYSVITYNDGTTADTAKSVVGVYGDTGQNWYVWVKYAAEQPTKNADMTDTPSNWIGIYSGTQSSAPASYTAYTWAQFKGNTGDGIASIEKTDTVGLVDTYTITMTSGAEVTFTVTNGKSITTVTLTGTTLLTDTYTISFNDGTSTTFTVTNGRGIDEITKTTEGLLDTYTIEYNDNSTFVFTVSNGRSISTIEKTGTSSLTDTYTVTYNDGTTSEFTVKNGRGVTEIKKTGTVGLIDTYTIAYNDGTTGTFTVTNGRSINTIEYTSSSGLTDTYTVTYNDGTTSRFTVTNGKGISTIEKTGTDGLVDTYTITFNDNTTTPFTVKNGANIESVEKTSTVGLVDTYTVTLTDGETSTFTVTNAKSIASITQTSGTHAAGTTDTYTITFNDGDTVPFTVYNGANGEGAVSTVAGIGVTDSEGDVPLILWGNGVPAASKVGQLKQLYYDLSGGIMYICTGISGSTYTWSSMGITVDDALSTTSANPVRNSVVTGKIGTENLSGFDSAANLTQAANELMSKKAPTDHSSTGTGYGVGNASKHGHLKLSSSHTSDLGEAGGTAATPAAVKEAYDLADSKPDLSSTATDIKMDGTQSAGESAKAAKADHVHPTDTSRAPLDSPAFTGTPTSPTPTKSDNSTKVATTAFVQAIASDLKEADSDLLDAISLNSGLMTSLPILLEGKTISIIGDSISTYQGWSYDDDHTHYPNASGTTVTDVSYTWWKQIIDYTGATLGVNASYSGSSASSASAPSFYYRVANVSLGSPDAIFVELGTNDSGNSVEVGGFDFTTTYTSLSETTFANAYIKGIKGLKAKYPSAVIICIALNMNKKYMDAIEIIAQKTGCYFAYCYNYERESGSHPGRLGMRQIANHILSFYTEQQLYNGVLSGDTYTNGKILFADQYNAGDVLSSNVNSTGMYWKDADDSTVATILMTRLADGGFRIDERVQKYTNGTRVALEQFARGIDANNNPFVTITTPSIWWDALKLCVDFSADITYPNGNPADVTAVTMGNFHMVQIRSAAKNPWSANDVIATIPSSLAPTANIFVTCTFTDNTVGTAKLLTTGDLAIGATSSTGNTRAITQVFWFK